MEWLIVVLIVVLMITVYGLTVWWIIAYKRKSRKASEEKREDK